MKDKEIASIHYLRIIACFLVIVTHTNYLVKTSNNNFDYLIIFYDLIAKIAVPLFFMISGALYLNKKCTYWKMIKKIFFKIFVPLLIASIIVYFKRNPFFSINNVALFIKSFMQNDIIFPYWFFYTLFGLYLFVPLFQKIVRNIAKIDYIVFFGMSIVFLTIYPILIHYNVISYNNYLVIGFITIPVSYFFLGYYIYHVMDKINKPNVLLLIIITIISVIVAPVLVKYDIYNHLNYYDWYGLYSFSILLLSFLLTYIFKTKINFISKNTIVEKIIKSISDNTFYVYLIQSVLLGHFEFVYLFLVNKMHLNNYISLLLYQILFFILLNIIAFIIRKTIFIIKKGRVKNNVR